MQFAFRLSINHSKMAIPCTLHPVLLPPGKLWFSLAFKLESDTLILKQDVNLLLLKPVTASQKNFKLDLGSGQ